MVPAVHDLNRYGHLRNGGRHAALPLRKAQSRSATIVMLQDYG